MSAPSDAPRGPNRFHARVLDARSPSEIADELGRTGAEPEGVGIMTRKAEVVAIRLDGVSLRAAPLLKQELLAVGGDSSHARGIADHSVERTSAVLLATPAQYRHLLPKLERQPFGLDEMGRAIERALAYRDRSSPRELRGLHRSVRLGERTLIMGVVNVTPDSFSDGGRFLATEDAVAQALRLESEGADMIDLGGESTRPGAEALLPEVEWRRIGPVLNALHRQLKVPISVDTRHPETAQRALAEGADLLNDVSGLRSPAMREVVAATGAPAILMHMRGDPSTMQSDLNYDDLRGEVFGALADAVDRALAVGIRPEQLLVDPGLGFGKSAQQSLELLARVGEFRSLGLPVVVGASRKSFLGVATGGARVDERAEAGIAAAVAAALQGVDIVRVHDVLPTRKALAIADRLRAASTALDADPPAV